MRICLIGNAGYLKEINQGEYIDSFDVVCRCNHYQTKGYEKQVGTKTDWWFFSFHPVMKMQPAKKNICVVDYKENKTHKPQDIEHELLPVPQSMWEDIFRCKPSTGARAFWYLLGLEFDELYITGFSFSNDYDYYYDNSRHSQQFHDMELEGLYFLKMMEAHRNVDCDQHIKDKFGI